VLLFGYRLHLVTGTTQRNACLRLGHQQQRSSQPSSAPSPCSVHGVWQSHDLLLQPLLVVSQLQHHEQATDLRPPICGLAVVPPLSAPWLPHERPLGTTGWVCTAEGIIKHQYSGCWLHMTPAVGCNLGHTPGCIRARMPCDYTHLHHSHPPGS
jgi:hypothetical protein